jgi:hypothetical protein
MGVGGRERFVLLLVEELFGPFELHEALRTQLLETAQDQ